MNVGLWIFSLQFVCWKYYQSPTSFPRCFLPSLQGYGYETRADTAALTAVAVLLYFGWPSEYSMYTVYSIHIINIVTYYVFCDASTNLYHQNSEGLFCKDFRMSHCAGGESVGPCDVWGYVAGAPRHLLCYTHIDLWRVGSWREGRSGTDQTLALQEKQPLLHLHYSIKI